MQLSHPVQADAERVLAFANSASSALVSNQQSCAGTNTLKRRRIFDSTLVTQSTGQTSVLHGLAVKVSGHTAPLPTVGLSTPRVRDAVPPSHVSEHVAQLDQAPTMQSTACIEGEIVGDGVGEGVADGVGEGVGLHANAPNPH